MLSKAQASPTPRTLHADASMLATALPCTPHPKGVRTSIENVVGRHLQLLVQGLLENPSTRWLSRSSNSLRTRQICSQRRIEAQESVSST